MKSIWERFKVIKEKNAGDNNLLLQKYTNKNNEHKNIKHNNIHHINNNKQKNAVMVLGLESFKQDTYGEYNKSGGGKLLLDPSKSTNTLNTQGVYLNTNIVQRDTEVHTKIGSINHESKHIEFNNSSIKEILGTIKALQSELQTSNLANSKIQHSLDGVIEDNKALRVELAVITNNSNQIYNTLYQIHNTISVIQDGVLKNNETHENFHKNVFSTIDKNKLEVINGIKSVENKVVGLGDAKEYISNDIKSMVSSNKSLHEYIVDTQIQNNIKYVGLVDNSSALTKCTNNLIETTGYIYKNTNDNKEINIDICNSLIGIRNDTSEVAIDMKKQTEYIDMKHQLDFLSDKAHKEGIINLIKKSYNGININKELFKGDDHKIIQPNTLNNDKFTNSDNKQIEFLPGYQDKIKSVESIDWVNETLKGYVVLQDRQGGIYIDNNKRFKTPTLRNSIKEYTDVTIKSFDKTDSGDKLKKSKTIEEVNLEKQIQYMYNIQQGGKSQNKNYTKETNKAYTYTNKGYGDKNKKVDVIVDKKHMVKKQVVKNIIGSGHNQSSYTKSKIFYTPVLNRQYNKQGDINIVIHTNAENIPDI